MKNETTARSAAAAGHAAALRPAFDRGVEIGFRVAEPGEGKESRERMLAAYRAGQQAVQRWREKRVVTSAEATPRVEGARP